MSISANDAAVLQQVSDELNKMKSETERAHRLTMQRIQNLQRIVSGLQGGTATMHRQSPTSAGPRPIVAQREDPKLAAAREAARGHGQN